MTPFAPLDLALASLLSLRRFGWRRTMLAAVVLTPVYLWSLPPVSCSCFGPMFRRCDGSLRYLAAVKSDLKNLASQQEIYFADTGSYTADPVELAFTHSDGVVVVIQATQDSWVASATHRATGETRRCGIHGGAPGPWSGLVGDVEANRVVCST